MILSGATDSVSLAGGSDRDGEAELSSTQSRRNHSPTPLGRPGPSRSGGGDEENTKQNPPANALTRSLKLKVFMNEAPPFRTRPPLRENSDHVTT